MEGGEPDIDALTLLTPEDCLDRVVGAVEAEDAREAAFWMNELEERGEKGRVNTGHSVTSLTPLIAASLKPRGRVSEFLVRFLKAKGATLPSPGAGGKDGADGSMWLEQMRSWVIEVVEEPSGGEGDVEIQQLLSLPSLEAQLAWVDANLPQPASSSQSPEAQRHAYGGTINEEGELEPGEMRAASLPADYERVGSVAPAARKRNGGHMASSPAPRGENGGPRASLPPRRPLEIKREWSSPEKPRTSRSGDGGVIDLTEADDRSPSPLPRIKHEDDAPAPSRSPKQKRPRSRERSVSRSRDDERPSTRARRTASPGSDARAHLRVDNLPLSYTPAALTSLFTELAVPGVLNTLLQSTGGTSAADASSPWGLASFSSLALAQHAFALLRGKRLEGREVELKIYSADGEPVEPFREVRPVAGGGGGGAAGGTNGPSGWANRDGGPLPPQNYVPPPAPQLGGGYSAPTGGALGGAGFGGSGALQGGGGGGGGGRYFPRPRVPVLFTAAELARRVYCGSLKYGITMEQVAELFSQRAGVVARVLRVIQAGDGSHAFAFVQLPDAITADHALKVLHGTVHDGHLLQIEHVNEINHRWLFSLTLHNLPLRWQYRDVSDFLISTIGSFAGLIVNRDNRYGTDPRLHVRVELRYKTELKWACQELHGLVVDQRAIEADIDQPWVKREMDRELAYKALIDGANGAPAPAAAAAYDPANPSGGAYENNYPALPAGNGGGATPSGSRRAPPPPPPPAASPSVSMQSATATQDDDDGYNPFAPSWMLKK